jgi:hypothetical protein
MIGNEPAKAGQRIGITTQGSRAGALGIHFDATTDPEGHFGIERLPAGSYVLFRYLDNRMGTIVFSHPQPVEITPGKAASVEMGGRGMRVEGRIRPSGFADLDWTANRHTLTAKEEPTATTSQGPDWEDFVRRADYEAASRGRVIRNEMSRQYTLTFDKDGSFFVDDVPPGEYLLQIKVTEPPPRERFWMEDGKLIGMMSTNVVVPKPLGGPVGSMKIGPYVLPVANVGAGAPMPAVQVQLLNGKTVELGGKKETPQAILFWAPWSEKSREALGQFNQGTGAIPQNQLLAAAVALEEDTAEITKSAQVASWTGVTAQLTGTELLKGLATQPIDELPLLLVIDSNGQLITKTSNMARLTDALAEAVSHSSKQP